MKILHIADCHLDSAMERHLNKETAAERRLELYTTFTDILRTAVCEGVSLLLIAGDLFDTPTPAARTRKRVLDYIAHHKELTVIYIEGNHDAGVFHDCVLPDNMRLVRAGESETFRLDGVDIHAVGYGAADAVYRALPIDSERHSILLAHGTAAATRANENPDILPFGLLAERGLDHAALGHYHTFTVGRLDSHADYCYAGIPEGRGFDETGEHGYVVYDTETRLSTLVPCAKRTLHELSADISSCENEAEMESAVRGVTIGIPETDMVRLTLRGTYREKTGKNLAPIETLLSRFFFYRLKDESRLAVRPEDYVNDVSLRGEFVRRVFAIEDLSEEDRERMLSYGLRALCGEDPEDAI